MTNANGSTVTLIGTGDIGPVHGPSDGFPLQRYTELVRPVLESVDVRFGNCERQYSSRGSFNARSPHGCQPPEMAQIFTDCGFDAVTIANNHMYDFGPDALVDTRKLLQDKGIAVTGAGKDLAEARLPAIVESHGLKIGFLGYCSVLPEGGIAGDAKPGIAPLRVNASYEGRGPHLPARVLTEPDADDLEMVLTDITALRPHVDILITAFHWGAIWVPRIICDYQVTVAHACIDAGVDAVMGHHAHVPKAIEMYQGSPIFYSLSNFCMTKPFPSEHWAEEPWKHGALRNHTDQDPAYPLLPYGKNAKRTLLAKLTLSKRGVERAGFIPMMIDTSYRPEPLTVGDSRFDDMVEFMDWSSEGFPHQFRVQDDEVVVLQPAEVAAADQHNLLEESR